ncbi:hypothetical protein FAM21829_02457 [Lentilactobacillus parabuchneri]|nr:hypothetical protein FAM21829_02457 [Lentilactobacillus parabuchneri]
MMRVGDQKSRINDLSRHHLGTPGKGSSEII